MKSVIPIGLPKLLGAFAIYNNWLDGLASLQMESASSAKLIQLLMTQPVSLARKALSSTELMCSF